ncbi:OPT family small oligopeptide transporter [[Candida] zeylanoides]
MSDLKGATINPITSIVSGASRLEPEDHQVDLAAISSQPISLGEIGQSLTSDQKFFILKRLNYDGLVSLEDLPVDATFMIEKIESLTVEESLEILRDSVKEYKDDPNYPAKDLQLIEDLLSEIPADYDNVKSKLGSQFADKDEEKKSHSASEVHLTSESESVTADPNRHEIVDWKLQVRLEGAIFAYHSPYPEVRAIAGPYDDPSIPCETFRAYVIGIVWMAIGAFINQFFQMRQPAISFSTSVAQLFLYPTGQLWYYVFPDVTVPLGKYSFRLSPGPWTYKEQMFATIIFAVFGGTQYVSYNFYTQKVDVFYGNKWVTWGYQILLALSNNFLGFGFAGILRRFACYPVKAIWPTILPTLALNQALLAPERKENINGWTISRYYFFFIACAGSFLYFWIPDYLFGALSTFNWMTWIKPDNFNLAMITGSVSGLGVNPITTFDWNILDFGSPLVVPFFTQVYQYAGMVLSFFIICAVYWTNSKWTAFLPINNNGIFNNQGGYYNVREVLDDKGLLDIEKYKAYGPPFYTAANLVVYGTFFAMYPFSVFYESIVRWPAIQASLYSVYTTFRHFRTSVYEGLTDPHSRMMSRYKEVPDWCYLIILVIALVLAIVCVEIYPTQTPVWTLFFALGINLVFLIPLTALASSTGFSFGLNVLVELIIGYALPGNSQALMFVKAFGYNIDGQAQNYVSDQKMGHYAKIPPRALFRGQILSVFIGSFIALAITNWQIGGEIEDLCVPGNKMKFTCPPAKTYFSASVLWGTIGPKRVFGGLYPVLRWCFLIGFLLVFPALAFRWYGPKKIARDFQPSIFMGGFLNWAPYNLSYYTGSMYLSIAFMYYIKKHYLTWWEKYNFVLSGALGAGVAFSSIIIFFAMQYHDKSISWWGNNVMYAGLDGASPSRYNVTEMAPDGYFGPRIGHFP